MGCVGLPAADPPPELERLRVPPGFAIDVFARDLGPARYPRPRPPRHAAGLGAPGRAGAGAARRRRRRARRPRRRRRRQPGPAPRPGVPPGRALRRGDRARDARAPTIRPPGRRPAPPVVVVRPAGARGPLDAHHRLRAGRRAATSPWAPPATTARSATAGGRRSRATTAEGRDEQPVATGLRNAVGPRLPAGAGRAVGHRQRARLARRRPPGRAGDPRRAGGLLRLAVLHWDAGGLLPDPDLGRAERCRTVARPSLLYQAHTAPLGLAFYTGTRFPPEYRGDLFVALHGSWNHSTPTGYKVIRVRLDGEAPRAEDFATGWVADGRGLGPAGRSRGRRATGASSSRTTARASSTGSAILKKESRRSGRRPDKARAPGGTGCLSPRSDAGRHARAVSSSRAPTGRRPPAPRGTADPSRGPRALAAEGLARAGPGPRGHAPRRRVRRLGLARRIGPRSRAGPRSLVHLRRGPAAHPRAVDRGHRARPGPCAACATRR